MLLVSNIFEKIIDFYKKHEKIILSIAFAFFITYLIGYIMVGSRAYLNSDSCFIVDYALEQVKTGEVFPKEWLNTNDFWIYSLIPLINIFYRIGAGLFLSRQLSVLIQTVFLFILLVYLFKNQLKDYTGLKIFLLLILSGLSGTFFFELFGDATYATIICFMLLELIIFLKFITTLNYKYLIPLGIILMLLTCCSLRFPIFISAPLICVLVYFVITKSIKKEYIVCLTSIVISTLIGFVGYKYLCSHLLLSSTVESKFIIKDYMELAYNCAKIMFNYLMLCGSTLVNTHSLTYDFNNDFITISSPFILLVFVRFLYALITVLLPFLLLKHVKKMSDIEKSIYVFITSFSFIMFFFLLICNMAFWFRYITPILFFLNFLYPFGYKYIFSKTIIPKGIFVIFLIACISTSVFFVTYSWIDLKSFSIRDNSYQEVTDYLASKDLHFGYIKYPEEHNLFFTLSEGSLRVARITQDGTAPHYWLCSNDWYKEDFYKGRVFFIRKKEEEPLKIEEKAIKVYDELEDWIVFVFDDNKTVIKTLSI